MDKPDFSKLPESDVVVNFIAQRYRKGHYTLALFIGLPNSGKSSASQRIGELVSMKIHRENRVTPDCIVDNLLDLIKQIREAKEPGKIIVVEEMSVLFPSRRAMAKENVAIGKVLDTCRKRGVILLANAPIWPSIDSHIRAMAHLRIECLYILKGEGVVVYKPHRLRTSPGSGKTYTPRFHRDGKDVHRGFTRMPNMDTWDIYEGQKDKFLDEVYGELEQEQQKKLDKKQKESDRTAPRTYVKALTAKEMSVHALHLQGLTHEEIGKKIGVSRQRITHMVKNIARKTNISKENSERNVSKGH